MTDTHHGVDRPELVLIGGGEHARVVIDAAHSRAAGWRAAAFVDPDPRPELQALGLTWLGDDATALPALDGRACIIAVGGLASTVQRQAVAARFATARLTWATVVHQSATVAPDVRIGDGVAVMAGAVVNPGARLGEHVIVNTGAIIEHDVDIEAFAHVGPGAVVGGGTTIGRGAFVGLGAHVRDHVRSGPGAVIGMGAVVIDDVAEGAVVVGTPARPVRMAGGRDAARPASPTDQ
jgi:sugar O-acyltransferase (sialic acid O-acetyltransferase NeuD family)